METYFMLNLITEKDMVQFSSLHLEGEAYEWWFHGCIIVGHDQIQIFDKLKKRILDIFELKGEEEYLSKLAMIKQNNSIDDCII